MLTGASAVESAEPGVIEIPSYAFNRGNAKTFADPGKYADGGPMVAFGGQSPVVIEYDLELPVDGSYEIGVRYAARTARPVDFYLDDQHLGQCCRATTGSWSTSSADWEESFSCKIKAGEHTLRMKRAGAFPHVMAIRLKGSRPFPEDWKLERPDARTLDSPPPAIPGVGYDVTAVDPQSLELAIQDLVATFGEGYENGETYLARLETLAAGLEETEGDVNRGNDSAIERRKEIAHELIALRRKALLENPLLNFERLLVVKRSNNSPSLGLPRNWQSNSSLPKHGFDDEIAVVSPVNTEGELRTLFEPPRDSFVGDVDLNFDADRMLFSMVGKDGDWQVFEVQADGQGLRQLTGEQPGVDSYDACYLPDGNIIFTSTACFTGVPCVFGSAHVAVLYRMDADGGNIRQLCFDQDHDWCPTVMNNGRVLYTRWEYTGTPHSNTRLLFHMNPDGTEQMEYYGSNSYWPNSFFYARPIPNHPTKVVSVIGGHHDKPRMGELVIFDPASGRREDAGAVQRIPGHGEDVEMRIRDGLTRDSWPKFLHPYPLNGKYFIVSCKPSPQRPWGIYLVDTFDNFVLLNEEPGYALLEPIPLRRTPRPRVIPDKVDLTEKEATVYLSDIYAGGGLQGVPRGTVKKLRVFTYHYAYQNMGGLLGVVGMDGPWDIKRLVGTVPVRADGSAKFRVPANMPLSLQPLDEEGKALQLMRSWMTAMPGEVVQCAGCHEPQNSAPPSLSTEALQRPASEITPWRGPLRGFSYPREVRPVVDRYCVGCHDGRGAEEGGAEPNLRGDVMIDDWAQVTPGRGGARGGKFSVGYYELSRYVRRPGIESDYHMLNPLEYHADTTQLVQMLQKGHHGVELDDEAWDRLITWIDLNCPYHGTWGENIADPGAQRKRRRELLKRYAGLDDDPEAVPPGPSGPIKPIIPEQADAGDSRTVSCERWPFDAKEAVRRQQAAGSPVVRQFDLGGELKLELALIPAGQFVMGGPDGPPDQRPLHRARIQEPFWMGRFELTNAQYALFDPTHDSRVESKNAYQFGIHGYPMNKPHQPVVRVSWDEVMKFCQWLSEKTGKQFSLPTEAQWEYACRAGSAQPMYYGTLNDDFAPHANMADASIRLFASDPYTVYTPLKNPTKYDDWIPRDPRFDDGALLPVEPGSYQPNAWGLYDMHGNVAEWTRSTYQPYPTTDKDEGSAVDKVVRGGSWRDRPVRCSAGFRLAYPTFQKIYNVGVRVVCGADVGGIAKTEQAR